MSWWSRHNPFRKIARDESTKAFLAGQVVAREQYIAGLLEDANAAKLRGLEASLEAISYVNKLDASDPANAAIIELFRTGVVDQAKTIRRLLDQPMLEGEEQEKALDYPFVRAEPSETSSATALPKPTPKALSGGNGTINETPTTAETEPPSTNLPPIKRGRGRPRKHPRLENNRNGGQAPTA